ncbi:MAG: type III-A CRISPR-associated protein Csm2 [Ignavibacteria bacterium]|nr:type III-A CRISPR-associated protein Csm2 [Ignavibacteria bacterium]
MLKINSFFDNSGKILRNLISDEGNPNVKTLAEQLCRSTNNNDKKPIEKNQLRKFYDNFLKIYHSQASDDVKKVQLLMLKAQAEYAEKRLKIRDFKEFISNRISLVVKQEGDNFKKNLDAFKLHFEALVGYFPK